MLERYWPDAVEVNTCIKNEAETADVAVLLAVHQPSPLVTRNVGTLIETPVTETDLLSAFLTEDVPSGALILPITGPSGVGKSHMIRWLDAQLRRSTRREKLHIIRIPKSASLRTVVELILEPLSDDPRYAKARENLTTAVAAVNLKTAVVTFRAELENVLNLKSVDLEEELRKNPPETRAAYWKALTGAFTTRVAMEVVESSGINKQGEKSERPPGLIFGCRSALRRRWCISIACRTAGFILASSGTTSSAAGSGKGYASWAR
jgi:hypothetical protein